MFKLPVEHVVVVYGGVGRDDSIMFYIPDGDVCRVAMMYISQGRAEEWLKEKYPSIIPQIMYEK